MKYINNIIISAFFAVLIASGTYGQEQRRELPQASLSATSSAKIVNYDHLLISPDGNWLVGWNSPPSSHTVFSSAGKALLIRLNKDEKSLQNGEEILSFSPIVPAGWSQDSSKVYFLAHDGDLIELRVGSPSALTIKHTETPSWFASALQPLVPLPSNDLTTIAEALAATLQDVVAQERDSVTVKTIGLTSLRNWAGLFENDNTLRLEFRSGLGERVPSQIPSTWLKSPRVALYGNGYAVVSRGFAASVTKRWTELQAPPWSTAALTPDGQLIGVAPAVGSMKWLQSKRRHERAKLPPGTYSVQVNRENGKTQIYGLALGGLFKWTSSQNQFMLGECAARRDIISATFCSGEFSPYRFVQLGTPKHQIPALLYYTPHPRGLVVNFHGGPAGGATPNDAPMTIKSWNDFGYDVLDVSYSSSASVGIDVVGRIERDGPSAIQFDADLIAKYLRNKRYAKIIAAGSSFGAIPAMTLEKTDTPLSCVILIAPYLRYTPPRDWTQKSEDGGYAPEYQELFEKSLLGTRPDSRTGFPDWLNHQVSEWRPKSEVYAYYASDDAVSNPGDINNMADSARVHRKIIAATHSMITWKADMWDDIEAQLRADC